MSRFIKFLTVSVLIVALSACSFSSKGKDKTINFAFFPNLTHSQALLGMAQGDFQKELGNDYKIDWKQFNAGSEEVEAFMAGAVDIGYIGPGPAINGFIKTDGDLQVIAGATDAGAILVVRSDSTITDVKDLDGKRIAIPQFGNTQDLMLRSLISNAGLKDTTKGGTVEILQVNNPDVKALFDKKEIDAALVPEPWGTRLIKEVNAKVVLDFNDVWRGGKYPSTLIIARKDFIEKNPAVVEKILKTHLKLTDEINNDMDKSAKTINIEIKKLTNSLLENDVLTESFKRMTSTYNPEKEAVSEMVQLSLDTGVIKERPENMDDMFNLDILNKLLKEKGLKLVG